MRNVIAALCLAGLPVMAAVYLSSCDAKSTAPADEKHQGDYVLVYGPAGGGGETPYMVITYSTRLGTVLDTTLTRNYYTSFGFTSDGSKTLSTGKHAVPPESSYCLTWVTENLTGEQLFSLEECSGAEIVLSPDEKTAVITDLGFVLVTFPGLSVIHRDDSNGASGAGFLTTPGKAYYYYQTIDSIYVVDYSQAPNISTTAIPLRSGETPVYPRKIVVDHGEKRMILISGSYTSPRYIQILDPGSLTVIEELELSWLYDGVTAHPDGERIFLSGLGSYGEEANRIDVYSISQNTISQFIGVNDLQIDDPFQPRQVVITPDGSLMYILTAGGLWGSAPVVGLRLSDKSVIQYLKPEHAHAEFIGINPVDQS
jgi:hypothetical protein